MECFLLSKFLLPHWDPSLQHGTDSSAYILGPIIGIMGMAVGTVLGPWALRYPVSAVCGERRNTIIDSDSSIRYSPHGDVDAPSDC